MEELAPLYFICYQRYIKTVTGRPIVSSIDSPTERISQLLDIILQPFVQKTRSFLKDTPDFINKIIDIQLTNEDWFLSLDVVGLYTNIPHDGEINAIKILSQNRHSCENLKNDTLIKLLKCVLKINNFTFNDKNYLQISGTAMGAMVAPTYANLYMNDIKESFIYTYKNPPIHWYRFIDDIWSIFRGTENELLEYLKYLNLLNTNLKFTATYSKDHVEFLDVVTYRLNHQNIATDLYSKPTNSYTYLD